MNQDSRKKMINGILIGAGALLLIYVFSFLTRRSKPVKASVSTSTELVNSSIEPSDTATPDILASDFLGEKSSPVHGTITKNTPRIVQKKSPSRRSFQGSLKRWKVRATLVQDGPSGKSLVLIQDNRSLHNHVYHTGDLLGQARIEKIARGCVFLQSESSRGKICAKNANLLNNEETSNP